mmetsp:Transcript_31020/g.74973  ORF Transcript_31020/g.74973 Transcript_31020/m.74973 type:complete len:332 (-) Transcript_31020:1354-2349(-)
MRWNESRYRMPRLFPERERGISGGVHCHGGSYHGESHLLAGDRTDHVSRHERADIPAYGESHARADVQTHRGAYHCPSHHGKADGKSDGYADGISHGASQRRTNAQTHAQTHAHTDPRPDRTPHHPRTIAIAHAATIIVAHARSHEGAVGDDAVPLHSAHAPPFKNSHGGSDDGTDEISHDGAHRKAVGVPHHRIADDCPPDDGVAHRDARYAYGRSHDRYADGVAHRSSHTIARGRLRPAHGLSRRDADGGAHRVPRRDVGLGRNALADPRRDGTVRDGGSDDDIDRHLWDGERGGVDGCHGEILRGKVRGQQEGYRLQGESDTHADHRN